MTENSDFKALVRRRMQRTGERYTTARSRVLANANANAAPAEAMHAAERFLAAVDDALPGLVVGCYLTGSATSGDFRPRRSDVDVVALVQDPLTGEQLDGLQIVQSKLARSNLDGLYLTIDNLATGGAPEALFHDGVLLPNNSYDPTAVARRELVTRGVHVRGPSIDQLDVHDDTDELQAWVRANLHGYWADWIRQASGWTLLSLYALIPRGIEWCVLGPATNAYTLATGEVTSKTDAGEWCREHLDARYESILTQALRIRNGGFAMPINGDRKAEALSFMTHLVQTF